MENWKDACKLWKSGYRKLRSKETKEETDEYDGITGKRSCKGKLNHWPVDERLGDDRAVDESQQNDIRSGVKLHEKMDIHICNEENR